MSRNLAIVFAALIVPLVSGCVSEPSNVGVDRNVQSQESLDAAPAPVHDAAVHSASNGEPDDAAPEQSTEADSEPTLRRQTMYSLNGTFQGAFHIVAAFDAPAGTQGLSIDAPFGRNCVGGGRTTLTWPDGRVTGKGAWECNVGGSCLMCGLGGGEAGPGRYTLEIVFVGTTEMDLRIDALVAA